MDKIDANLLSQVADLHGTPQGSFNIRKNGECLNRNSTADIEIVSKKDKSGIDVIVKPNVKNKSVHIPVIVTVGGFNDLVYNDFYIGENAEVLIVAGCGIHNTTDSASVHNGIHSFHLKKGSKVRYVEKHLGEGKSVLNPVTNIKMDKDSVFEMETIQLGGVTSSNRKTKAMLKENAKLVVREKILTSNKEVAKTLFNVALNGKNSSVEVSSRSVAKGRSYQEFVSKVIGKNECFGHVECDGIVLDNATILSSPKVFAKDINATLIHEAAIGKIAGEQIVKLQTLGLSEEEAQNEIVKGFLK